MKKSGQWGMTGLAGLPAYLEISDVLGLSEAIWEHLSVRVWRRGFIDLETMEEGQPTLETLMENLHRFVLL